MRDINTRRQHAFDERASADRWRDRFEMVVAGCAILDAILDILAQHRAGVAAAVSAKTF
jgi:exopolyphosphatase/pppGpp-phosphohydrolase